MNSGGGISEHGTTGPATGGSWGGPQPAYLPPVSNTPDWDALALRNQREDRRRRVLRIGGGALGVLLVGGIVAGALALQKPDPGKAGKKAADSAASPLVVAPVGPSGSTAAASASASVSASASASGSGTPSAAPGAPGGSKTPSRTASAPAGAAPGGPGAAPPAGGGPAQLDDRSGRFPLALAAGSVVGQTEGHSGPTLVLNSSPGAYGQTGSAVVDTGRSFTVSAMVRNNAPTGGRSVISQGSDSYYSFDLGRDYWADHNQWVFKVQTAAGGQDNTTYQAFSKDPATTGAWTLLTGVYDAGAKTISLYVNGQLAQTTQVKGVWQTTGPLQVGRVRYKSAWSDDWDGAISDVQVWDQALPASRVTQLGSSGGVSAGVSPLAAWLLP